MELIDLRITKRPLHANYNNFDPYSFKQYGLKKMILLPDFNPGRSLLPVGTVSLFDSDVHEMGANFLGRDIGCGMSLFKTGISSKEINLQDVVDQIDSILIKDNNVEFTLGNHFIDFCKDNSNNLFFIIHAGYKQYGSYIVDQDFSGDEYYNEVKVAIEKAKSNRLEISSIVCEVLGINFVPTILDKPHNSVSITESGILYRKGAVQLFKGEKSVLPSNLIHPILIIEGKEKISDLENSFCHGTGRELPKEDLQNKGINYNELRNLIKIPSKMTNRELRKLMPTEYKNFLSYFSKFNEFISIKNELDIIGYVGYKRSFS